MQSWLKAALAATALSCAGVTLARAEMLAMVTYETKAEESIRALRVEQTQQAREDGLAIIDVDPASEAYGKILAKFPLPEGPAPHHQYYNPDKTKIYVTANLLPMLHVVDLTRAPYRITRIDTPDCRGLDTVVFSGDGRRWWLTCQQTNRVLIGDAITNQVIGDIPTPDYGPHGLALNETIDRILVTSTGFGSDHGESITVVGASTGKVLSSHKVSNRPSPSKVGPVEILFLQNSNPTMVYVTNMFGGAEATGSLWAAVWNSGNQDFDVQELFDFETTEGSIPVAMRFSHDQDRLSISTAHPGHFHVFDISENPLKPKLLKTLPAAQGAHHMAFSPDERLAFIENGVLNFPGLSDGSITVIDMDRLEVIDSIDTFKDAGYAINHILMLPQ